MCRIVKVFRPVSRSMLRLFSCNGSLCSQQQVGTLRALFPVLTALGIIEQATLAANDCSRGCSSGSYQSPCRTAALELSMASRRDTPPKCPKAFSSAARTTPRSAARPLRCTPSASSSARSGTPRAGAPCRQPSAPGDAPYLQPTHEEIAPRLQPDREPPHAVRSCAWRSFNGAAAASRGDDVRGRRRRTRRHWLPREDHKPLTAESGDYGNPRSFRNGLLSDKLRQPEQSS